MDPEIKEDKIEEVRSKYGILRHYYGDITRRLFILAGVIMLVTLPFINNRLPVSPVVSIIVVIILSLGGGLLAPRNKWSIPFNLAISVCGVLVFEYYAVEVSKTFSYTDWLFIINQTLAVIFLFASYNSAKTLRSLFPN